MQNGQIARLFIFYLNTLPNNNNITVHASDENVTTADYTLMLVSPVFGGHRQLMSVLS